MARVANLVGAVPGDLVVIQNSNGALWAGILLTTLLPVAGLIAGAAMGSTMPPQISSENGLR